MADGDVRAGWFGDPMGRHAHRYWDGGRWTGDVEDHGHHSVDMQDVPAGWHKHPEIGKHRYWDGVVWRQEAENPKEAPNAKAAFDGSAAYGGGRRDSSEAKAAIKPKGNERWGEIRLPVDSKVMAQRKGFAGAMLAANVFKLLAVLTIIGGIYLLGAQTKVLESTSSNRDLRIRLNVVLVTSTVLTASVLAFFGYVLEILVGIYKETWDKSEG